MVGLRKSKCFSGKTKEEAESRHSAGRNKKEEEGKGKTVGRLCIFGIRAPLTAASAPEPLQKSKDDKTNYIKDNLFNKKMLGKLQLTVARCSIPSEFFPQSNLTPIPF